MIRSQVVASNVPSISLQKQEAMFYSSEAWQTVQCLSILFVNILVFLSTMITALKTNECYEAQFWDSDTQRVCVCVCVYVFWMKTMQHCNFILRIYDKANFTDLYKMNVTIACIVSKAISVCKYNFVHCVQHFKLYLSISTKNWKFLLT